MLNSKGKYETGFSAKILDDNFQLVTLLAYSSLQWNRKFHGVGSFSIELINTKGYNSNWKYVYTEARPELGIITQINWKTTNNRESLIISGYFAESELNYMICYPKPTHKIGDAGTYYGVSIMSPTPSWVTQEGTADVVATAFFNGFKSIAWRNYKVGDTALSTPTDQSAELDLTLNTVDAGIYNNVCHTRNGEPLADKLYDILKTSYASISVTYDYENNVKYLNIVHGKDRTQSGHDSETNPILFTTRNGTISTASVVTSTTTTKDAVIQYQEGSENQDSLVLVNAKPDVRSRFLFESIETNQSEFIKEDTQDKASADKAHKLAVLGDATNTLNENKDVINIQVDYTLSSYKYMQDFDLGDLISVEIPEIDLSFDAQIVECHEVVKNGTWNLSLTLGDAITIRKRGNM